MKVYALKWKQSGQISCVEAYTNREQAQKNADTNNAGLASRNFWQRLLGRYWVVAEINVRED